MISQLFFYLHASTTDGIESDNYSFVGILVHVYVPLALKEPNEDTYITS